jgi:hypothetical protein
MVALLDKNSKRKKMSYEVIDNYLPKDQHKILVDNMLGPDFAWYFNDYGPGDDQIEDLYNYQFTHNFYSQLSWVSDKADLVYPFVDKIEPRALIRIKANLSPATPHKIVGRWHTDYPFECKTAVYYLNDNDGHTEFASGEKVESVANRMVIFDSQDRHVGTTSTNVKARCVINFNYL